jgi:hypothetical protein
MLRVGIPTWRMSTERPPPKMTAVYHEQIFWVAAQDHGEPGDWGALLPTLDVFIVSIAMAVQSP